MRGVPESLNWIAKPSRYAPCVTFFTTGAICDFKLWGCQSASHSAPSSEMFSIFTDGHDRQHKNVQERFQRCSRSSPTLMKSRALAYELWFVTQWGTIVLSTMSCFFTDKEDVWSRGQPTLIRDAAGRKIVTSDGQLCPWRKRHVMQQQTWKHTQ